MQPAEWKSSLLKPAAMNINCSQLCLHPWSEGVGNVTRSGAYLSPENAIDAILRRLAGSRDCDMVLMMLCAPSASEFLALTKRFADVFPLPEIRRMNRLITSQLSLDVSKMQIPAREAKTLPESTPLSLSTARRLTQTELISTAVTPPPLSFAGLERALAQFRKDRQSLMDRLTGEKQDSQGRTCPVWSFCSSGDTGKTAIMMKKNIPHPDWVLTAIMLFAGEDLSALRGALI
ncbi:hypothetical protein PRZ05_003305 [Escherichia coli]|nr:hypothetical protein [Escherichia coli]